MGKTEDFKTYFAFFAFFFSGEVASDSVVSAPSSSLLEPDEESLSSELLSELLDAAELCSDSHRMFLLFLSCKSENLWRRRLKFGKVLPMICRSPYCYRTVPHFGRLPVEGLPGMVEGVHILLLLHLCNGIMSLTVILLCLKAEICPLHQHLHTNLWYIILLFKNTNTSGTF